MALTLGDNFSYQGAKPLDARLKYDTLAAMKAVADSTMYDGCMAYCVATDKTYQWKSTNTVDPDSGKWREYASGGGHDIKNNGVAVTSRDTMNFTDFDIADDSTNEETDVKAHRLTAGEMADIMSTLPGTPTDLPVMFDERGTEYQIGWYVLANGTKKPVYHRDVQVSLPAADHSGGKATEAAQIPVSNLDMLIGVKGVLRHAVDTNWFQMFPWIPNTPYNADSSTNIRQVKWDYYKPDNYIKILSSSPVAYTLFATLQYTKTTDTPS